MRNCWSFGVGFRGVLWIITGCLAMVAVCGLAAPGTPRRGSAAAAGVAGIDLLSPTGEIVVMLYEKLFSIATRIIDFEERLIFRIRKQRPIDEPRARAALFSGKRQMRSLYRKALRLQQRLPAGDPALTAVDLIKLRTRELIPQHAANSAIIDGLLGRDAPLAVSVATAAEYFEPPTDLASEPYPVRTLDSQF